MEFLWWSGAILLVLVTCGLAGALGARVQASIVHRRLYSLELALADLEASLLTEKKKRASEIRWNKRGQEDSEIEALLALKEQEKPSQPAERPWRFQNYMK